MSRRNETIWVYEEYKDAAEKHRAQRGAKRGRPTGKARGYCFVFVCNGYNFHWEGVATIHELDPGSNATHMMAGTGVSPDYLRDQCRRVGKKYLPKPWAEYLANLEKND